MKSLTYRDVGFDCPTVIKRDTEEEIMQNAGEHASIEYNIKPEDMTSKLQQQVSGQIQSS